MLHPVFFCSYHSNYLTVSGMFLHNLHLESYLVVLFHWRCYILVHSLVLLPIDGRISQYKIIHLSIGGAFHGGVAMIFPLLGLFPMNVSASISSTDTILLVYCLNKCFGFHLRQSLLYLSSAGAQSLSRLGELLGLHNLSNLHVFLFYLTMPTAHLIICRTNIFMVQILFSH